MLNIDEEGILDRLLYAIGSKKYAALASALEIKPQSISDAKAKKKIPTSWAVTIASKYGVTVDWLLFGSGPLRRSTLGGQDFDKGDQDIELEVKVAALEQQLEALTRENRLLEEVNNSQKEALHAYKLAVDALLSAHSSSENGKRAMT